MTVPIRYQLSEAGLKTRGGKKSDQLGFYNPIPPVLNEEPTLCLVYSKRELGDAAQLVVQYVRDTEAAIIS